MRVLGAVLAGGQSRRFGTDKALALVEGKPLISHVIDALVPQVEMLVVAGREWPGFVSTCDLPGAGDGPLGGLAGALSHASENGFDMVLCASCDALDLPGNLLDQLQPGPAVFEPLPVFGLWPATLAPVLIEWMAVPANRSVYRFAHHIGARMVKPRQPLFNINHPGDLPS